jgi:Tfp pilus assembly protein PilV
MIHRLSPRNSGFTLVEVVVAGGVALIGFLAVTLLNAAHLRYVKSARQSNAATLCLQERAEQLRLADWRKLTNPVYLRDTFYATSTKSSAPLSKISEKISISAYPDGTVAQDLIVQRQASGVNVVLRSGDGLPTQRMAKVELEVDWVGADGRNRVRATTTLMANGGISRMNLPGFGAAAGAPGSSTFWTPTPAPSTSPTPIPTGPPTPTPITSPTPTPPTPTPTPTPASSKKPGRGNVGGKSGQG